MYNDPSLMKARREHAFNLRLYPWEIEHIKAMAAMEGISRSDVVRLALEKLRKEYVQSEVGV
jgi:predicted DNA binding CopG/RHH family protein